MLHPIATTALRWLSLGCGLDQRLPKLDASGKPSNVHFDFGDLIGDHPQCELLQPSNKTTRLAKASDNPMAYTELQTYLYPIILD